MTEIAVQADITPRCVLLALFNFCLMNTGDAMRQVCRVAWIHLQQRRVGEKERESKKRRKKKSPESCDATADGKKHPWNEAASTTAHVTFTRMAQMVAGMCRGGRLAYVERGVRILHCDSSAITSLHKQRCVVTVKQLPSAALKP